MSEPAIFVFKQDDRLRCFYDRWAGAFLFRELLWGPDDLDRWMDPDQECELEFGDESGGAVIDLDAKRLTWLADVHGAEIPRVAAMYERLLAAAWPGFEINAAVAGAQDLAAAAGVDYSNQDLDDEFDERPRRLTDDSGGFEVEYDDQSIQDEDFADDESDFGDAGFDGDAAHRGFDDEEPRAWVTIVDDQGAVRHRCLDAIPRDLIEGKAAPLAALIRMPATELPPEESVREGIWIDQSRREVGFWGGADARQSLETLQQHWADWDVAWADQGYIDQCAVSGPEGVPMSDEIALGRFLPLVLSTKRFDMQAVFGAVGGKLKSTAVKATGCLLIVICFPVLLFAAISGQWMAGGVTIAIVCLLVVAIFKFFENKVRAKFSSGPFGSEPNDEQRRPVAGPIDKQQRRQRIDDLLQRAGLPALAQIEPHFAEHGFEELLDE